MKGSLLRQIRSKINRLRRYLLIVTIVCTFCVLIVIFFTSKSLQVNSIHSINNIQLNHKKKLEQLLDCKDKFWEQRTEIRGPYKVLYNYVPAKKVFKCAQSITYTTHGDYTFLDNLEVLLSRWQGPISISVFSPGDDFNTTLESIQYLRKCGSIDIADLVTFHVYFPIEHQPKHVPENLEHIRTNCSKIAPWYRDMRNNYRATHAILYPVNVGRNVARQESLTHFVLASDIELYPSPRLIPQFLNMIREMLEQPGELQLSKLCSACHEVPKGEEWRKTPEEPKLKVFHVGYRLGEFSYWEPFYIGTNQEPKYSEELSWEGMQDKMTQCYAMCLLGYQFHILNNAFLVHRPGIRVLNTYLFKHDIDNVKNTNKTIYQKIVPEFQRLYGTRNGCKVNRVISKLLYTQLK